MNHTNSSRHRWGNALFCNALIISSLTLVSLHKLSPTSLRFEGTMAGLYTLGSIALGLFLVALVIHRTPPATPEMDNSWGEPGEFYGEEVADFTFPATVVRDGVKLPVIVCCAWSGAGNYSVRIFEAAVLAKDVVVGWTEYPKGSHIVLTEDEENCLACDDAVDEEIQMARDADDTDRDNERERR